MAPLIHATLETGTRLQGELLLRRAAASWKAITKGEELIPPRLSRAQTSNPPPALPDNHIAHLLYSGDAVHRTCDRCRAVLLNGLLAMAERLDVAIPLEQSNHTAACFALDRLGYLPQIGERFDTQGWRFEIVDIDGRRIDTLAARLAGPRRRASN